MMDVNRDVLSRYLNVSTAKLKSKGVDSVRSRVTNLTEFRPELTLKEVEDALIQAFGEVYQGAPVEEPLPSIEDPDVRALYDRYRSDEWRLGRRIPFDVEIDNRLISKHNHSAARSGRRDSGGEKSIRTLWKPTFSRKSRNC